MAENTTIIRQFESGQGIDYQPTDLTRDSNYFKDLTNCEFYKTRSWRKRPGCQLVGQRGNFLGIHTYSYADANGATQQELIALNDNLWRLNQEFLILTRTAGPLWAYKIYQNAATQTYRFQITEDGTAIVLKSGNTYIDLGTGLEELPYTVQDLRDDINAVTGYSIALPSKTARVNGAQSNVTSITVYTGHNIAAGDYISLYDYNLQRLVYRFVTATTKTTITFNNTWPSVTVKANQSLGNGAAPAASIPVTTSITENGATKYPSFYYWTPIIAGNAPRVTNYTYGAFPFSGFYQAVGTAGAYPRPTFKNQSNVCYISFPWQSATSKTADQFKAVYKYDGLSVYRVGLPPFQFYGSTKTSPGGSLAAGTYKYAVIPQFYDNRGNLTDNNWCYGTSSSGSPMTFTLVAGDYISPSISNIAVTNNGLGYNVRCGYNDAGSGVGITTINCWLDSSKAEPHSFEVGDTVYFYDAAGNVQSRTVTAVNKTAATPTLTIDLASTVKAATSFSRFRYFFYHTQPSGQTYYYKGSVVPDVSSTFTTFDDKASASYNTAQLLFNDKSKLSPGQLNGVDHNPPLCSLLESHQGSMVYAGIYTDPQTLRWSEIGEPEYCPQPENIDDVPSTILGGVSAIASDSQDRLAIFKDRGYYEFYGDLTTGAYGVNTIKEGDYGNSTPTLTKVDGAVFGVGKFGLVVVDEGQFAVIPTVSPAIWNSTGLRLSYATSNVDTVRRKYRVYIPGSTPSGSLMYVYDLSYKTWVPWSYASGCEPSGDLDSYQFPDSPQFNNNQEVVWCSLTDMGLSVAAFGHVFRELGQRNENSALLYWDNAKVYTQTIKTAWLHLGSPSLRKTWVAATLYHFIDSLESGVQPYPVTVKIKLYRDFIQTTPAAIHQYTISSSAEFEKVFKLYNQFGRAFQIEIYNDSGGESLHVSGYQLAAVANYTEVALK